MPPLLRSIFSWLVGCLLAAVCHSATSTPAGERGEGERLQRQLDLLLAQKHEHASDPAFLVRLADLYLDLGDDESRDEPHRRAAYDEGAKLARQALDLDERNAHAHYLYAANLGSAAQLKGVMASALTIQDIKRHAKRALELNPDHAAALHMMGMMLEELPWVLGGDHDGALTYLRRAVTVDPHYTHARLDLAKVYLKRRDVKAARNELDLLIAQPLPSEASAGDRRHREEAIRLRESLRAS